MYELLRPALFQLDAETAHRRVMALADAALSLPGTRAGLRRYFRVEDACLRVRLFDLDFPNPVGLAAGFDKNAEHVRALSSFGFGHVEIGTVTGEGQPGNERPRLFRLPQDRGLLNRMGFNNQGSEAVAQRLARTDVDTILGVNIGKTKAVALEDATSDYEKSFRRLFEFADYFVVNVSSPNTPGLRQLQSKEPLTELLSRLQELNEELASRDGMRRRPLLVKIAPDLTNPQLDDVMSVVEDCALDGVVATNTTIRRDELATPKQDALGPGGVSGKPVQARSLEVIRYLHEATQGRLPIIGVGGIFDATDALAALGAGASLVQVWTGFVYEGPSIVRNINRGLVEACRRAGWTSIGQARAQRSA